MPNHMKGSVFLNKGKKNWRERVKNKRGKENWEKVFLIFADYFCYGDSMVILNNSLLSYPWLLKAWLVNRG